jgi:oligopeptide transport system permease protein
LESALIALVARRLVAAVIVVFCVATFAFFALRAAPGGPFDVARQPSTSVRGNIERAYHLDRPLGEQYFDYLRALAVGDLGWSMRRPEPVRSIIAQGFPVSLELGFWALAFALFFGVGLGVAAAAGRDGPVDHLARAVSLIGISIPAFVVGPLLIEWLALRWGVLPAARWDGPSSRVLPAITLGLAYLGVIARLTRAGTLENERQDFVRTARAKGLGEPAVLFKHALRPAIVPVVSYLGPAVAGLVTGSIVVESLFALPGLGGLLIRATEDRDYPVVCGILVFSCVIVVAANVIVDVAVALLDPRVRR